MADRLPAGYFSGNANLASPDARGLRALYNALLTELQSDWQVRYRMEAARLLQKDNAKLTSKGISFVDDLSGWTQTLAETATITPVELEGGVMEFSALKAAVLGSAQLSLSAGDGSIAAGTGSRLFTPSEGFYIAFRYRNVGPFPAVSRGFSVGGWSDQGVFQLIYIGREFGQGAGDNLIIQINSPGGFVYADTGYLIDALTHDVEMWSVDGVNILVRVDGEMVGTFAPVSLPDIPLSPNIFGALSTHAANAQVTQFSEYLAVGRVAA